MKKRLAISIIAAFLTATVSISTAATITCTVDTIKDGIVTLNCGEKASKIKEGAKVKVKTAVKRKAVEGC